MLSTFCRVSLDKKMNEKLLSLLDGVQKRDEKSFEKLYLLTKDRVRFFLLSRGISGEELSEIMADSYVIVFEKAGKFRGKSQVLTWIFGIVNVKCREYFRKSKRQFLPLLEIPDLHNYELQAALSADLKRALSELSREEYNLFLYRICFCMTYEEIHRILHVPVGTLRKEVFDLRVKLKNSLRERR